MTSKRLIAAILNRLKGGKTWELSDLLMVIRKEDGDADPTLYAVVLAELEEAGHLQQYNEDSDIYICKGSRLN